MGLAVEVGVLADLIVNDEEGAGWLRESLENVNTLLKNNNLPPHTEPENLPPLHSRASILSYPYSFLHYLRRFAAHAARKPRWTPKPFPESDDPTDDPLLADEQTLLSSHLLCHSDCEGFYIPIDFGDPLFADDEDLVPGGMLGSSYGLMRELVTVAPFLGITLTSRELSEGEAARINTIVLADGPFWIELAVWFSLFEAARLSIEHRTAICFK